MKHVFEILIAEKTGCQISVHSEIHASFESARKVFEKLTNDFRIHGAYIVEDCKTFFASWNENQVKIYLDMKGVEK